MTNEATVQALLNTLAKNNIRLALTEKGELAVRGEKQRLTPALIKGIKTNKAGIVAWLGEASGQADKQGISPLNSIISRDKNNYALSFSQQRLWFLDQMGGGSAQYNMISAFTLKGTLNRDALQQALSQLYARHEVLHSVYVKQDGEGRQKITQTPSMNIRHITAKSADELPALVAQEAGRVFDLQHDPMLRCCLIDLLNSTDEHVLVFTMHHIASDEWSLNVAATEFIQLYQAAVNGDDAKLPAMALQYIDYAHWQKQYLASDKASKSLEFFTDYLADMPQVHSVPGDYERGSEQRFEGAFFSADLSPELSAKLRKLANQHNVTLFFLLQSLFVLLLAKYSGEDDLVIGTPVAGRDDKALQGLIGFFVNTVPLRTKVNYQLSFADFLKSNRQQILQVFEHQDYPFDALVENLQPERSLSYAPLMQIIFSAMDNQAKALELPGLEIGGFDMPVTSAKFDFNFSFQDNPEGIGCYWNYATSLFTQNSVAQLQRGLTHLCEAVCQAPDIKLADMSLLDGEQQQLLNQIESRNRLVSEQSIPERFAAIVAQHGDKVAGVDSTNSETITYQALGDKAQNAAAWLQNQGLKPGEVVGLYVERSLDMLVGMLAILRAGGAYLSLDTNNPKGHTKYMLGDAQVKLILSQSALESDLAKVGFSGDSLMLDKLAGSVDNAVTEVALSLDSLADSLAYVMYTSDSSGLPKGVKVTHSNVMNLVCDNQFYLPEAGDIIAQCSSLSFDRATFEIWGALLHGNQCAVISDSQIADPQAFADALIQAKITVLSLPTTAFNQGVTQAVNGFKGLRYLMFGGGSEENDVNTVNQLIASGKPEHLIHLHGASETTGRSAWYEITGPRQNTLPIAGASAGHYVLDKNRQLLPQGAIGELYIGGAGLAQGYLNRDDLTDQVFINNPFKNGQSADERLYKTGDLVRIDQNDDLIFVGRIDQQVKLRGSNKDSRDIAQVLSGHEAVGQVVVLPHAGVKSITTRLIAYVVPSKTTEDELSPDTIQSIIRECRRHLRAQPVLHRLPQDFVILPSMPLTNNGKIDVRALPEPQQSSDSASREPDSETERFIAQLWQSMMQLKETPRCGQNFFKLGGHSLLATKMQSQISEALNVKLPIRSFFEYPTIEALAALIDDSAATLTVDITLADRNADLPLSFSQQRLWFIDQMQGQSVEYNMPVVMQLNGPLQIDRLHSALNTIVERHEVLRTTYQLSGNTAVQKIHPPRAVTIEQVDLRHYNDSQLPEQIQQQVTLEAGLPFVLAEDLMLRARLLLVGLNRYVLIVNQHHIASDGWSMDVITGEFIHLYAGLEPLPELPLQYADYAKWQQTQMSSEQSSNDSASLIATDLDYWQTQLADSPQVHQLGLDYPRPAVQSIAGKNHAHQFNSELTAQLKQLAAQQDVTLFMLMQSLFSILLSRYSGESDILMGTPVSGREHPALGSLVGFFVNNLVLRSDVDSQLSLKQYLAKNKAMTLDAFDHQEVPFDYIVESLKPQRSLSHTPLYQVVFSLQTADRPVLQVPGLEISGLGFEDNTAKFDLNLIVVESNNELTLTWQYATALFAPQTIENLANSMACLAQGAVANVHTNVAKLPLLNASEQGQTLDDTFVQTSPLIHQAVAQLAQKTPDAPVVADGHLTYAQLDRKANQLARHLLAKGLTHQQIVVLHLAQGANLLIGMLAVLKAGGVYVPFDPANPLGRLLYVLKDTNAKLLLTEQELNESFDCEQVLLDQCNAVAVAGLAALESKESLDGNSLACVMYTFDSTGTPKGVMFSHQNVMHLVNDKHTSTNYRVDTQTFESLATLINGGKVIDDNSIHYVLDDFCQPVPQGAVGKLYVGGAGVARGYLNHDVLTHQAFINNPFGDSQYQSERLFNTDCWVRVDQNGQVIYLSHIDEQAKSRRLGISKASGVLEQVLSGFEAVEAAAVVVQSADSNKPQLVAYVVPTQADTADTIITDCRRYLRAQAALHRLPEVFVVLQAMPLTSNGKIDRRQLPQPQINTDNTYVAPTTAQEIALATLWQQLFEKEQVGIDDNFFDIGGHSLFATRLVADVNQQFAVNLNIRDIFEHQTIRALSVYITQAGQETGENAIGQRFDAVDEDDLEELEL